MENEATTKTPIPARSGFRNFASGLHSRFGGVGFCILIFALPNPLSLYFFVPLCLSGHESIMQNKPNSPNNKTTATLFAAKVYEIKPPLGDSKKQTQTNPIPPPPSCAGKESRISERNAYPDLSGQHQRSRIQDRESTIFPILPRNHGVIAQNKPNSLKDKTNATPYAAKDYENNARPAARKNKPKQTQSLRQSSLISHPSSAFCLPPFLRANSWKFVVNPFPPCLSVFVSRWPNSIPTPCSADTGCNQSPNPSPCIP